MPCFTVPCRAVPCRTLPYRAVPCRAVPCRAVPCRAVPCRAVPCRAVPCRAVPCSAISQIYDAENCYNYYFIITVQLLFHTLAAEGMIFNLFIYSALTRLYLYMHTKVSSRDWLLDPFRTIVVCIHRSCGNVPTRRLHRVPPLNGRNATSAFTNDKK